MAEADFVFTTSGDGAEPKAAAPDDSMAARRKKLLAGIAAAVVLAGAGYGLWYGLVGMHHVETDNAYVGADSAQITPMVAGQVAEVPVSDTRMVRRGEVLVRLNDSDAQIALAAAEAELARAKRQFGQTSANSSALGAQVRARAADVASARAQMAAAQASYDRAKVDYDRRRQLVTGGAVSGDEMTAATNALANASAALEQARAAVVAAQSQTSAAEGTLAANDALIKGATVNTAPEVLAAESRVRQAKLDFERTVIRAPIDGVVTGRMVQVGQRVAPGTTLMRVVPVGQVYVDANFKEGQLTKVRPGQKVTLTADLYGDNVEYHGRVVGFAGGTGATSALIPAQNATGNWIKVVQRLPVRIQLDPRELANHPLRVGLSMTATIDTSTR